MDNEGKRHPANEETDISKAQATQQPAASADQQPETGEQTETGDQAATGQAQPGAGPDEALQGETSTQQRTDIEGTNENEARAEEGGFVGSQSDADSSSELG